MIQGVLPKRVRTFALSALHRIQKLPNLVRSFFQQPECNTLQLYDILHANLSNLRKIKKNFMTYKSHSELITSQSIPTEIYKFYEMLPPRKPAASQRRFERFFYQESINYYGFSSLLSEKWGFASPIRTKFFWFHGVPFENIQLFPHLEGLKKSSRINVPTCEAAVFLRNEGFHFCVPSGLPFAYTETEASRNMFLSNCLLAIPRSSFKEPNEFRPYFDYLSSLRSQFEFVFVMVPLYSFHGDINQTELGAECHKRGLLPVLGGQYQDANSLRRVRYILDSFTYTTTNYLGSSIAYALYAGCKVSISGLFDTPRISTYASDLRRVRKTLLSFSLANTVDDYLSALIYLGTEGYARSKFGEFFKDSPLQGIESTEIGAGFLGSRFRLNREDLVKQFDKGIF